MRRINFIKSRNIYIYIYTQIYEDDGFAMTIASKWKCQNAQRVPVQMRDTRAQNKYLFGWTSCVKSLMKTMRTMKMWKRAAQTDRAFDDRGSRCVLQPEISLVPRVPRLENHSTRKHTICRRLCNGGTLSQFVASVIVHRTCATTNSCVSIT